MLLPHFHTKNIWTCKIFHSDYLEQSFDLKRFCSTFAPALVSPVYNIHFPQRERRFNSDVYGNSTLSRHFNRMKKEDFHFVSDSRCNLLHSLFPWVVSEHSRILTNNLNNPFNDWISWCTFACFLCLFPFFFLFAFIALIPICEI